MFREIMMAMLVRNHQTVVFQRKINRGTEGGGMGMLK